MAFLQGGTKHDHLVAKLLNNIICDWILSFPLCMVLGVRAEIP